VFEAVEVDIVVVLELGCDDVLVLAVVVELEGPLGPVPPAAPAPCVAELVPVALSVMPQSIVTRSGSVKTSHPAFMCGPPASGISHVAAGRPRPEIAYAAGSLRFQASPARLD
jgi:hypothetical protein